MPDSIRLFFSKSRPPIQLKSGTPRSKSMLEGKREIRKFSLWEIMHHTLTNRRYTNRRQRDCEVRRRGARSSEVLSSPCGIDTARLANSKFDALRRSVRLDSQDKALSATLSMSLSYGPRLKRWLVAKADHMTARDPRGTSRGQRTCRWCDTEKLRNMNPIFVPQCSGTENYLGSPVHP